MEAEKFFEHKKVADALRAANNRFVRSEAIAAGMEMVCHGLDFAEKGYNRVEVRHAPEKFDDRLPQLLLLDGKLTMYVSPRADLEALCGHVERFTDLKRVSHTTCGRAVTVITLGW